MLLSEHLPHLQDDRFEFVLIQYQHISRLRRRFNSYKEKYGDIVEVDGAVPSRDNILSGKYGMSATYYLTVDGSEQADVLKFIEYTLSEEGRKAIDVNFILIQNNKGRLQVSGYRGQVTGVRCRVTGIRLQVSGEECYFDTTLSILVFISRRLHPFNLHLTSET